jgi:electron transfer flavoprotein beta subunit
MKLLQIMVCIKQVPDPEGPVDAFQIDPREKKVIPIGIPPVINPFDENALEAAIQIKDTYGAKVTAISMGEKLAQPVLRKALAAGADELILLVDPHFKDLDSFSTAYVLSKAIQKIGAYDLILTGRQAGDWDFGVTGLLIAEMLQIPSVNLARKIEMKEEGIWVERITHDGYELVKTLLPALITVSSEIGEPRYISIRALQSVRAKPIEVYEAKDLDLDIQKLTAREILDLSAFQGQRDCRYIEGDSPQQKGANLALKLQEDRVILLSH